MRFEFATAARIIFGAGTLREIGPIAREFGRHALVVTGRDPGGQTPSITFVRPASPPRRRRSRTNPRPTMSRAVSRRAVHCDFVIGFGGGAALDAAKAIAALLTNDGDLLDYLEVIGRAQPLARAGAPSCHPDQPVPVRSHPQRGPRITTAPREVARSVHLLPRLAPIDPELTYSLPPAITASPGSTPDAAD
jgi:alcohol dehydrogenase class IV